MPNHGKIVPPCQPGGRDQRRVVEMDERELSAAECAPQTCNVTWKLLEFVAEKHPPPTAVCAGPNVCERGHRAGMNDRADAFEERDDRARRAEDVWFEALAVQHSQQI